MAGSRSVDDETIVEALADPVCTVDADGRFAFVNDAFEGEIGYNAEEAEGEPLTLIMEESAAANVSDAIERIRAVEAEDTATVEIDLRRADGTLAPVECHLSLVPGDDEERRAVVVLRDISRLKEREARLENFAAILSHDLRNPMDVAIGRAEILPEVADVDDETEEHLDDIYDSLVRMEELIQDVLALTHRRDEDLELAAVSLGAVATEAWHSVETEDATLSVEAGQEILANKSSLLRLLENLFRNAVEHGGSDTTVEVGMFGTEGDGPNGFFVADDGPGIPPEDRSRVFEDGFSTRHGGTGLGLSIARDIAGAHDWTIDLTDDAEGARFEFTGVQLAEGEGDE